MQLNILDILLLFYAAYNLIRLISTPHVPVFNNRIIELVFLLLFYFGIKYVLLDSSGTKTTPALIVITGFLLAGFLQSMLGIFQAHNLFGYYSNYFLTTGTFGNPSYYSGFLTSVFPFAAGIYLLTMPKSIGEKFIKYAALFCSTAILMALPLTKIRGDWAACMFGLFYILYHKYELGKYLIITSRKIAIGLGSIALICLLFYGLYNIRPDSAFGRLLIWKVSAKIINDYPVLGAGFNRYSQIYNNYQAEYFAEKERSEFEKKVADNVRHSHNEFIQHYAELGIIGFLLLISILYTAIIRSKPPFEKNGFGNYPRGILIPVKASIIAISISAFFAFPFQILPNLLNFILLLGIVSSGGYSNAVLRFTFNKPAVRVIAIVSIIITVLLTVKFIEEYEANKKWKTAFNLSSMMIYDKAISVYQEIFPLLSNEPDFILNYGGTLSLAGRHEEAVKILEEGKNICSASSLYISLGNSYKELGDFAHAEKYYTIASYMIPNRFYPKYLLVKLYEKIGNIKNTTRLAKEIISAKPKIPTPAVFEIKNEMKQLLKTYQQKAENQP